MDFFNFVMKLATIDHRDEKVSVDIKILPQGLFGLVPGICPSVGCPHFSNVFFSEAAGPNEAKSCIEPSWSGGMKGFSCGLGHQTKMAAMPMYGKNVWYSPLPRGYIHV